MGRRPACASTQTGTSQRLKTRPLSPNLGGINTPPRIWGLGAIFRVSLRSHATGIGMGLVDDG